MMIGIDLTGMMIRFDEASPFQSKADLVFQRDIIPVIKDKESTSQNGGLQVVPSAKVSHVNSSSRNQLKIRKTFHVSQV